MFLSKSCSFASLLYSCVGNNWYSYEGKLRDSVEEGTITKGMWKACIKIGKLPPQCTSLEDVGDVEGWLWIVRLSMILSLVSGFFAVLLSLRECMCPPNDTDDDVVCYKRAMRFLQCLFGIVACSVFLSCIKEETYNYGATMIAGMSGLSISVIVAVITIRQCNTSGSDGEFL